MWTAVSADRALDADAASSRISTLYVREKGRWLLALLREWPDEGTTLRDVDWLIGSWESKSGDVDVRTTYEWEEGKNFIRCRFTSCGSWASFSCCFDVGSDCRRYA